MYGTIEKTYGLLKKQYYCEQLPNNPCFNKTETSAASERLSLMQGSVPAAFRISDNL